LAYAPLDSNPRIELPPCLGSYKEDLAKAAYCPGCQCGELCRRESALRLVKEIRMVLEGHV